MAHFNPLFGNPHLQTVIGHLWPRSGEEARFPPERRFYRTEPDVQVLVASQRPAGRARGEVVLVHGLEGSGEAGYMRGMSAAALRAGFAVHRFHMRTCGGTERLAQTLYHAGLTSDLLFVLREFARGGSAPVFLVGFSLGGNVVMKLAGELGESARPLVRGVIGLSTPLDLEACTRRLEQRENSLYAQRFVRRMRARLCATGRYRESDFEGLHSVRAIDDRITAPSFGFEGALHYYRSQSSIRYLAGLRIPALLVQAKDDTFIPFEIFESKAVRSNPQIRVLLTEHGGHLGFLGRRPHRFWAEEAIINWIAEQNDDQVRNPSSDG